MVETVERGWAGHFIGADKCWFRRNTLVGNPETNKYYVVSTVGDYHPEEYKDVDTIGLNRYYETMVFDARWDGTYWDSDPGSQQYFDGKWSIDHIDYTTEAEANKMHDAMVQRVKRRLEHPEITTEQLVDALNKLADSANEHEEKDDTVFGVDVGDFAYLMCEAAERLGKESKEC